MLLFVVPVKPPLPPPPSLLKYIKLLEASNASDFAYFTSRTSLHFALVLLDSHSAFFSAVSIWSS